MPSAPLIAGKLIAGGRGLASALLRRSPTVELDWDTRQKSRFEAIDSSGRSIAVFLPRGRPVRGGDVLVCEDGSLVVVRAQPQRVLAVTVRDGGEASDLLRAAYHLGNRHVPLQLEASRLQFEPDHVLAEMLQRMRLDVAEVDAPFEPEAGAYEAGHGHARDDPHEHPRAGPHEHSHSHERR